MSDARDSDRPGPASAPIDPHKGWRPADDDDSTPAVAYRARYGYTGVKSLRVEIVSLANSVGGLTSAVEAVKKLLAWVLRIVGAAVVLGAAKLLWDFLSTLHH